MTTSIAEPPISGLTPQALAAQIRANIERVGARFEGVLRNQMYAHDGIGPRDTASYSIVADEWPEVHRALRARLRPEGIEPGNLDAKAFTEFVAAEVKRWAPVVKASGAKAD